MRITGTIVIGAGQAGLAASRCLTDRGRDHVVLERGRIGQRWRSDTWDSLHLLTPNSMNTLPGEAYRGPDPDGFSSAAAFNGHLTGYAESFGAPVEEHSGVHLLRKQDHQFEVVTDRAAWLATNVIIATGWCDRPAVPAAARALPVDVHQVVPSGYRNPGSLPDGGVLVVGASATGVQLADELRAAGWDVTIAVGSHTRMPRIYRGLDIYWWLDRLGVLDKTIDQMPDPLHARHEPSAQLVGRPDHRRLDLTTLQADGVHLVGRVLAIDGHRVRLATDLPATVAAADSGCDGFSGASTGTSRSTDFAMRYSRRIAPEPSPRPVPSGTSTFVPLVSIPSCGRPVIGGPIRGCGCRCSTAPARSASAAAARRYRATTCSVSASSTTAIRASSAASAATPHSWPITSSAAALVRPLATGGILAPAIAAAALPAVLLAVTPGGRLTRQAGVLLIIGYAGWVTAVLVR